MSVTPRLFITVFLSLFLCVSFSSCEKKVNFIRNEGYIWNTLYHITYESHKDLQDSIISTLDKVGGSLSIFDESSVVSEVNRKNEVDVDEYFKTVYLKSKEINKISGGYFDPTVSPLITAWGFGPGHKVSQDTLAIDSIMEFIGIDKTRLENGRLIKDDIRTEFNFSAIAKGFGCDMVGEMLSQNGVCNYMIEIGGEIKLSGESSSGGKWKISIDTPEEDPDGILHDSYIIITLTDCGIATSGNYRNYREEEGKKFGHTISPVSGRPVITDILSATVIAPTAMEADALATACMALGSDSAKTLLEETKADGLFIFTDGFWMSEGFESLICK